MVRDIVKKTRRKVLSSAAGFTIFGGTLAGNVTAKNDSNDDTIHFSEISTLYKGAPKHSVTHTDDFLDYKWTNESKILIGDHINSTPFENKDSIVKKSKDFLPIPRTIESKRRSTVPIKNGRDQSPVQELQLQSPITLPKVIIAKNEKDIEISTEGEEINVSPGNDDEIELKSKTVEVSVPTDMFEQKDDPRRDGKRKSRIYENKKFTLTPMLKIKNHGRIEWGTAT